MDMDMDGPDKRLSWHPGFYGGIELEFYPWKSGLRFAREYELTKESLIADMLVIKKERGVVIDHPIGEYFREHNLLEYKSPSDTLSVDAFSKAVSYAYLYKSQGERENEIEMSEVSLNLFCYHRPRKLFSELEKSGEKVEAGSRGIYRLRSCMNLAIQIVVIPELPSGKHLPLRILQPEASEEEVRLFIKSTDLLDEQGERNNVSAVLRLSAAANPELYRQLKEELTMTINAAARYIFPDILEEERKEGREEGRETKGVEVVTEMLRDCEPVSKIIKYTQMSAEKIAEIARSISVTPVD